ncbi:ABC transporter permease [Paenibacillus sabinae]|uniref:Binding-protein-dependent transporters inner membrane component n=2 Tax=Paenibacillus sabinae TaxID=365617 RepID=X4ZN04_9BACL|nr:ABC transporter permease [Paenibacillus sabinae]AHV97985.1 binding-protein-dependent transporters inner membrane component [Paenibacillus sabinae T27]
MNVLTKLSNRYAAVIAFLVLWEVSARFEWVDPQFIPPLTKVLQYIGEQAATGALAHHLLISLGRAAGGLAIALIAGVPLGIALAGWPYMIRIALGPVLEWLSHINPFVVFHIIIVFIGAGEPTKVSIIAWACIWPIMFSTLSGMIHADADTVKAARSFGLSRLRLTTKVLLPLAFPSILTGTRLAAGYALLFLIAAEMMGSTSGLGFMIYTAQANYQIVQMFSGVLIIAVLAIVLDGIMSAAGKRLVHPAIK